MNVTRYVATVGAIGLSAATVGVGAATAEPPPVPAPRAPVLGPPTGIGWSHEGRR